MYYESIKATFYRIQFNSWIYFSGFGEKKVPFG